MISSKRSLRFGFYVIAALLVGASQQVPLRAQLVLGGITGTVKDASGAAVPDVSVKARNTGTNLEVTTTTKGSGEYTLANLPIGQYAVSFSKAGFQKEDHTNIRVDADRTTTVDGSLRVGAVSTTIEVTGTPMMNQVDATNGYVVDQLTIEETPLGTGSFTQLAILAPGVNADFLGGSGSNAGLGNQAVFANGQRDTSNSFSVNGISTNNIFNGKTTSSLGENRFVLNTGENFPPGGSISTSTSVYGAIGQALPTPAPETIEQISVNAAMYDATQGANSGAHIGVVTKSGTNDVHGELYEHFQNSDMNAAPFFYNANPNIATKIPFMNRNAFGETIGGPIKKNKLFFFGSFGAVRIADAQTASITTNTPMALTNDRSVTGILNTLAAPKTAGGYGLTVAPSLVSPVALAMLNAKTSNGNYLIPTPQITNIALGKQLGYDVLQQGPNVQAKVLQTSDNIDYLISDKDRLAGKYYFQTDPTSSPFSSGTSTFGFPQTLKSGSQVVSLDNTVVLAPTLTWQQRIGFTRMQAYSQTTDAFTPSQFGINLPAGATFPKVYYSTADPNLGGSFYIGANPSFGNAGMYQNQPEYATSLGWVKGRHTFTFGASLDRTQLNIVNNNASSGQIDFSSFANFVQGAVKTGTASLAFLGTADRSYVADTAGAYANDTYKLRSNITVTAGVRWDFDGPLSERHGLLTAFNPSAYSYNAGTDTITGSGLVVAGNNPTLGTAGASNTLTNQRQWGIAPRIGIAWSPTSKLTVRSGFGIYYDRGELFSYLSAPAGNGISGPFGVTLAPPFVSEISATTGATLANPFPTAGSVLPGSAAQFLAQLPNLAQTSVNKYPAGNLFGPYVFSGYDMNNKLPYTENWTLDLQYQVSPSLLVTAGYVGNHGVHGVLPIPYNQPSLATPSNPVNGQIYSYGFNINSLETVSTSIGGNTSIRVPYLGYSPNSVQYEAEGVSHYDALQLAIHKRLSFGLQVTATYTWAHSLDDQSGLGLFYTGNNPLDPKSGYGTSDFDRTHVFLVNYSYALPKVTSDKALGTVVNGWTVGGQAVAQSGQPYSVYDYSGAIGGIYYGTYVEINNPIVPLAPGVTVQQAELQGTTGVNAGKPVLNVNSFLPQFLAPGQSGVPPCDSKGVCDTGESLYSALGRNTFRGPFGVRFDMTLGKQFDVSETMKLRFSFDAFNMFNHPNFDTPNNDVDFYPNFAPPAAIPPTGSLGIIQHTLGSPRFLQLNLALRF